MDLIRSCRFIRVGSVNAAKNATVTIATRRHALTEYESVKVAVTSCGITDVCFLCAKGRSQTRNTSALQLNASKGLRMQR